MSRSPNQQSVHLSVDGKDIELPVRRSTQGQRVIEIENLRKAGIFTYDPGFIATASCDSSITFVDGEQGILTYRGYPIEQLASHSSHLETCYLLFHGELPSATQLDEFTGSIRHHTLVHEHLVNFFRGFHADAHPMAMLCSAVGALSAFYHKTTDITDAEDRELSAMRLIAKIPTLAAMSYKHSIGQPYVYPDNSKDYASNFLYMMFSTPCESYHLDPAVAHAMDVLLLLHADHEQNASTSTVRLAASSGANPFACVSAGIASLWGPAHGGANEAALRMLMEIGDDKHIGKFIARAKDPDDPFRLMGFGHRIYKNHDPRARVMQQLCAQVLEAQGSSNSPLLRTARTLERIALEDDYFIKRKLYPNVDFYSGIILQALGVPTDMFTVIFAIGRTAGWVAHLNEMLGTDYRIGRPRQLYTGFTERDFVPLERREG